MSDGPGFFLELKRRHVWRVAVAYAIAGWLIVQIATQVFPFFNIPNWAVRLVVVLIAIGFPAAVAFAWIYELTPTGLRPTPPADSPDARSEHAHRSIGQRLNTLIVTVLVLAVALMGWRMFATSHSKAPAVAVASATRSPNAAGSPDEAQRNPGKVAPDSAARAAASGLRNIPVSPAAAIPEKSIAVLPFTNDSGQKDQQYFSDGLSEDLINALSQFDGLKVISRNSAFQFRNSSDDTAAIGRKLGVAHLLEGSVQRAGDTVRITATLVNAADGSIVWSERYDRPYKELFALQDAITAAVADALKARLLTTPGTVVQTDRPPGGNLDAYTAYQEGVALMRLDTAAGFRKSIGAFDEAIRIDPKYAAAYASLSYAWLAFTGPFFSRDLSTQATDAARKASATALKLDPDLAAAHYMHAFLLKFLDMDWEGAEAEYRRALQLAPNDPAARFGLGNLLATLGQNQRAVELTRQALAGDPRNATWYFWLAMYQMALGRLDDAHSALDTALALQPAASHYHAQLANVAILRGEPGAALAAAQQEPPGMWHDLAVSLALEIGSDHRAADAALAEFIRRYAGGAAYQIAQVLALRREPDKMFQWLDRAWSARDGGITFLLADPLILRFRDDPRFAAFCKKVGLPTTTDAVAMK